MKKTETKKEQPSNLQMRDGVMAEAPVPIVTTSRTEKLWKDVKVGEIISDGENQTWEASEKLPDGRLKVVAVGDFSNTPWTAPVIGSIVNIGPIDPEGIVTVITLPN